MFDQPKGPWEIVPFARRSAAYQYIDELDLYDVESFLRQFKLDYRVMSHLREVLALTDPVSRLTDDQVIDIVARRLVIRDLVLNRIVWRRPRPTGGGAPKDDGGAAAAGGDAGRKVQEPAREKAKDWIGVLVVDERGRPVKDVKAQLKLTDGQVVVIDFASAELAPDGSYRTEKVLDPGQCEISFPDLDASEWRPK